MNKFIVLSFLLLASNQAFSQKKPDLRMKSITQELELASPPKQSESESDSALSATQKQLDVVIKPLNDKKDGGYSFALSLDSTQTQGPLEVKNSESELNLNSLKQSPFLGVSYAKKLSELYQTQIGFSLSLNYGQSWGQLKLGENNLYSLRLHNLLYEAGLSISRQLGKFQVSFLFSLGRFSRFQNSDYELAQDTFHDNYLSMSPSLAFKLSPSYDLSFAYINRQILGEKIQQSPHVGQLQIRKNF